MSWAGLSSNQWVAYEDLVDAVNTGVFTSTGTPFYDGGTDQWVAKASASIYININTSNTTYAAKASNQWLAKQDLTPALINNFVYQTRGSYTTSNGGVTGYAYVNLSATYNVTSTITITFTIYTNLSNSYTHSGTINSGSINNGGTLKVYYDTYNSGEYCTGIAFVSVSPTSDSTYNYGSGD